MKWYIKVLKNYANFNGRAHRKEYWMFVLFNIVFSVVAVLLDNLLGADEVGVISVLYSLAVLIPGWAVMVRRLHDTGRSGWMILISLVPFIGTIWLLVLLLIEGDTHKNKYGPSPKVEEYIQSEGL